MVLTILKIGMKASAEHLCRGCSNAHVVRGSKGEELIYCNFGGGGPRLLGFEVCECTDFADRETGCATVKTPVGYIRPGQ